MLQVIDNYIGLTNCHSYRFAMNYTKIILYWKWPKKFNLNKGSNIYNVNGIVFDIIPQLYCPIFKHQSHILAAGHQLNTSSPIQKSLAPNKIVWCQANISVTPFDQSSLVHGEGGFLWWHKQKNRQTYIANSKLNRLKGGFRENSQGVCG